MSRAADEFLHNVKFASEQQSGGYAPFAYGHIANYDPKTHRVRVIIPSNRNEDDTPVLSSWMSLGGMGGTGWGIQIAPAGGASIQNPTAGELVTISRIDRGLGAQFVASMVWNQVTTPPFPDLGPGEVGLMSKSGAVMKFDKDANVTVSGNGNLSMTMQGTADITTQGACTLNAQGNLTLKSAGSLAIEATAAAVTGGSGTGQKLLTALAAAVFNTHTHPGNGDPPTQQMTSADETSVLTAQ